MPNQNTFQGKMKINKAPGGAVVALVVPFADPGAWFFEPFPNQELAEIYAEQNLLYIETESPNATETDNS